MRKIGIERCCSADQLGKEVNQPAQSLLSTPLQLQRESILFLDQPQSKIILAYAEVGLELGLTLELLLVPHLEYLAQDSQLFGVDG